MRGGAFLNGKEGRVGFRKNISLRRQRGKKTRFMHNFNDIQIIIMAGGVGSRFWPMSTSDYPKQFIDVMGVGRSLIHYLIQKVNKTITIKHHA